MQGDLNPFLGLVIDDWSFLDDSSSRTKCIKCNKSRKYYCYSCCIPLPHIQGKLPNVKLPLKVDIIKHPRELDGKSTAPHALILAPDDVTIHIYPCIPDFHPNDKVIVVFPSENSVTLDELKSCKNDDHELKNKGENLLSNKSLSSTTDEVIKDDGVNSDSKLDNLLSHNSASSMDTSVLDIASKSTQDVPLNDTIQRPQSNSIPDLKSKRSLNEKEEKESDFPEQKTTLESCPIERVVFIDCTWNQTRIIAGDERLEGLKKVELKSHLSNFWRTQEGVPKTYLSTIEAIYYFFKDFHTIFLDPVYRNEYDNLLFFFCFLFDKINNSNRHNKPSQEK